MDLNPERTLMFLEARSAPKKVANQFLNNRPIVIKAIEEIKKYKPHTIVTCARGSSDHAATFAKYVFEANLGIITSSAAPSIGSVYQNIQKFEQVLYLAISQSGKSPDILSNVDYAKAHGALTIALVNDINSPLANMVDICIPLHAGNEESVAATKTYICTLSAILQLTAYWSNDKNILTQLNNLPGLLKQAWEQDWSLSYQQLKNAKHLFVIGRGFGFGIIQEMALKFKETCGLHAEAYSAAEVKHGPMAIIKKDFPVMLVAQNDASRQSVTSLVEIFAQRQASIISIGMEKHRATQHLPFISGVSTIIEPILFIQSFYKMVNELSVLRGYNPDLPPYLNKVTKTV